MTSATPDRTAAALAAGGHEDQAVVELRPIAGRRKRTSVAVVVCTYRRNEPLRQLIRAVIAGAREVFDRAAVGFVVVDDNRDGAARAVLDEFENCFELGIHYRHSGKGNVSINRNIALEVGASIADWVLMTDDDCVPPPQWLAAHLDAQQQTGCDATTGAMVLRAPAGAPSWLVEQGFYSDYELRCEHLERIETAGTNNVMLRSAWIREHPQIRFLEDFGTCGGEDWIFFRSARTTGLILRFSSQAFVIGHEPPERVTLCYQLRNRLWLGNNEYFVNSFTNEYPRRELIGLAWARVPAAAWGLLRGFPDVHYKLAVFARATGYMLATFGVRLHHH